jgi:hypothetical protein
MPGTASPSGNFVNLYHTWINVFVLAKPGYRVSQQPDRGQIYRMEGGGAFFREFSPETPERH